MLTLLRRWRILNAAETALRILRVLVLVYTALPVVQAGIRIRKGKGR